MFAYIFTFVDRDFGAMLGYDVGHNNMTKNPLPEGDSDMLKIKQSSKYLKQDGCSSRPESIQPPKFAEYKTMLALTTCHQPASAL